MASPIGLIIDAVIAIIILIIVIPILVSAIRIVPEYQRLVKFRLGKLIGVYGPGVVFVVPIIDRVITIDLRIITIDMSSQKGLTRDNVEVTVDAAVYLRIIDPLKTVVSVSDYRSATSTIAAATLRDVIGMVDMDTLLTQREEIAKRIASMVDEHASPWGIKVNAVAIKDIRLPDTLIRAMAAQAEAERIRRSKIILAQADYEAGQLYLKAAQQYSQNTVSLLLRQLDTLVEIAKEHNMIIVVPNTMETTSLSALAMSLSKKETGGGGSPSE
ncbi:MAG: slipin family protein [Thermocladium sp.]|jgi:regulator of protease activity HflC (stomatin/prohibitin superfamily)|nr:MAG: membrane protease subunit, stomatin/prohibitin-like protein [Thermocladium sp. ECH_B]